MAGPEGNGRILCAIDTPELEAANRIATTLKGAVGGVKLGKEFFAANGPEGVRRIVRSGQPVFLDLKFHDIPNTVAGAVRAAAKLGCFMMTIHASGGAAMIREAVKAADEAGKTGKRPLIVAVTVLTSLGENDLPAIGQQGPIEAQVLRLARLAKDNGADGVVASPKEASALRAALGPDFKLVVPGVRPKGIALGDQIRVTTPAEAVAGGADWLVIGRPITGAPDPRAAARAIAYDLGEGNAQGAARSAAPAGR
jgi:orotidine-5'-phosphate decarboxylase